MAHTRK